IKYALLAILAVSLVACGTMSSSTDSPGSTQYYFQEPPIQKKSRVYPRLVNYFHRMDLWENRGDYREEHLAQWDVIILNPEIVDNQRLSLQRIRGLNPGIKILAWVPFGQSSEESKMSWTFPKLSDYFLRSGGTQLVAPWGGRMMNPWKNDFAWPKHVISFLENNYLCPGMYDGIMFDCIWENAPTWYSPDRTVDLNDNDYRKGILYLFRTLRSDKPDAIITGNGGMPWKKGSTYYVDANGSMAENAFGNEFGESNSTWQSQWDNYLGAIASVTSRDLYFFMIGDLQFNRTIPQSSTAEYMGENDKRRFRLALTTTLLGDGFFGFDRGDNLHGQLWWFAEYNVDLGSPLPGYEAPHSYRTGMYHRRAYSREFTNGSVIVNPSMFSVSISFSEDRVDASTRKVANTFIVPARDGRVFMKNQP
ncbi:MAG: hypothetical protein ABSG21_16830, partial [Spirochaetia bacterium]